MKHSLVFDIYLLLDFGDGKGKQKTSKKRCDTEGKLNRTLNNRALVY